MPPKLRLAESPSVGALVLAALVALFLATPLSRLSDGVYSSADFLQAYSLLTVDPGHTPANVLLTDPAIQMQTWAMYSRDELRAGRVPLWSTLNGFGAPHLGNYQSAVFSPFSLPFYLLGFRLALVVAAFLKLYALGLFTLLFLRRAGLGPLAALLGATIFTFSGHNVALLGYPHVGALCHLPAGLYFAEVACSRITLRGRDGPPARLAWPCLGFAIAILCGLLAGHPEAFYFSAIFLAVYVAWRLFGLGREVGWEAARGLAARLAVATVLGAGLAAPQLLPFLEYFEHSTVRIDRSDEQTRLDLATWPLHVFPNAAGNPGDGSQIRPDVPPPDFELVTMSYVGALALSLAGFALLFWRDRRVRFFGAVAAVWFAYAHDLLGFTALVSWIPTVDMAPMNRSQPVWGFCISALAALCAHHLVEGGAIGWRGRAAGAAALALAGAGLALAWISARELPERWAGGLDVSGLSPYFTSHLRFIAVTTAIGLALVAAVGALRRRGPARAGVAALFVLSFAQSGWLLRDYNPTIESRHFFPETEATGRLRDLTGGQPLLILGGDHIPPPANVAHGISLAASYDAMWVQRFDFLYERYFSERHNWRDVSRASERGLQLFGLRYLLAKWAWPSVDTGTANISWWTDLPSRYVAMEVLPGRDVVQTFTAPAPGLQAVCVYLSTSPGWYRWTEDGAVEHDPERPGTNLLVRVEEVTTGTEVQRWELPSLVVHGGFDPHSDRVAPPLPNIRPPGRLVPLKFEDVPDSAGREYRVVLSTEDGEPGRAAIAWGLGGDPYRDGRLTLGGEENGADLIFDFSWNLGVFLQVERLGSFLLMEFAHGYSRYWTVDHAVRARDEQQSLRMLDLPTLDPGQVVVLEEDVGPATALVTGDRLDPRGARLVQREDDVVVYLVDAAGRRLLHIDGDLVFLAHGLEWGTIERLESDAFEAEFASFEVWDDRTHGPEIHARIRDEYGLVMSLPTTEPSTPVEVLADETSRVALRVERERPGWLVLTRPWYPGWHATVDGEPAPLRRANFAFAAVQVPAGESEVVLEYDPLSFRIGLWIAGASGLAGLGLMLLHVLRRRGATEDAVAAPGGR